MAYIKEDAGTKKKTAAQIAAEKRAAEVAASLKTKPLTQSYNPTAGTSGLTGASTVKPKTTYTPPKSAYTPPAAPVQTAQQAAVQQYVDTGYVPNTNVTAAYDQYQQQAAAKPADYQSQYDAQIAAAFDKIMSRDKFSYDMNSDPLYQQMSDRYQQQGQMAMRDTIGQSAALTGGYGNSWAQSAGQQAYGQHLQALNDQVPNLRNAAYDLYANEGSEMYNQLNTMQGLDATAYGKQRDQVADWQTMLGMKQGAYENERGFDFDQQQFDYQKQQDAIALALSQQSSGGGGGSSKGKTSFSAKEIELFEAMLAEEEKKKKTAAARAVQTVNLGLTQSYNPNSGSSWR